jgi:ABC-type phosphate transport system substrate-binding protein
MRQRTLILIFLWASAVHAEPDITVIANSKNDLGTLTRKQVADIYMGRVTSLPNGSVPLPLDYQGDSAVRVRFYQSITGKNMAQINAYWARLSFTGQANPPRRLADKATIMQVVGKNQGALGYVDGVVPDADVNVTPVLNLK